MYLSDSWLREVVRMITNLDKILETIAPTFQSQIVQNGSFSLPTGKYNKTRVVISTVLSERADGLFTTCKSHLELFLLILLLETLTVLAALNWLHEKRLN